LPRSRSGARFSCHNQPRRRPPRDLTPHALSNAIESSFINRDGLVVGSPAGHSWGVWRNGTLEFAFGTADDLIHIGALGDDGAFAGDFHGPMVWRCS